MSQKQMSFEDMNNIVKSLEKLTPEQLAALNRPGGYLVRLKEYSIGVEFKKSNNITIPKYTGTYKFEYAQTINNK